MASPNDAEKVALLVGGKAHKEWSRYSIDSDLMIPADAWQLSLGLPSGSYPPIVEEGAMIQVRIGNETVLTGRIDQIDDVINKTTRSLEISGRDSAAVLVDCSCPIFVAKEVTLAEIVNKVVKPLGITKTRIGTGKAGITEKINIEPGMLAWDALQQSAEANGLWPWFEPDGTLVVDGPDYNTPVVAELIVRKDGKGNNVESLTRTRSMVGRFSEVTVLGQTHGTGVENGQHALKQLVRDEAMKIYRPRIMVESDITNNAAAIARGRKFLSDSRMNGMTLTARVKGHRINENGPLWSPGQRIHVLSEPHTINAVYFLMGRTFSGGRGQPTVTTLRLKEDGVWTLDAKKKKKKKGGEAMSGIALPVAP